MYDKFGTCAQERIDYMSECTHNCETCSANCSSRESSAPQHAPLSELSSVKKVIAVASGKGGVGKSMVTSMLAVLLQRKGYRVAVLDADITGPSIPRAFGLKGRALGQGNMIFPMESSTGIQIMSVNLLLEDVTSPVIWRGPVLSGVINQFWSDVVWREVDFMLVDMPPGTGDVPLTVFQSIPVDGLVTVATPQELVSMVVEKAIRMAEMMNVPMLGLVENMSYAICPNCNEKHYIFGESGITDVAERHGLKVLGRMPINHKLAAACDKGMVELFDGDWLDDAVAEIEAMLPSGE